MWCFEVIDTKTNQVLMSDNGFDSESEAEYYAKIDARAAKLTNYYVRTYEQ